MSRTFKEFPFQSSSTAVEATPEHISVVGLKLQGKPIRSSVYIAE
jgi:hypothetical protein